MGYTKSILQGVGWIAGIRVATRMLSLARTLIIARVLTPDSFGIFGIATLVLTFTEIFTETGVNIFLVQLKEDINKYISTVWIVSIIRGLFIAAIIFLAAHFVSSFFHAEESYQILLLICFVPIFRGFINPSVIKFQKDLLFHKEFMYRTSIFAVETLISIILILLLKDVSGLVWGMIISVLFEVVISFYLVKPTPTFEFNFSLFRKVIGYGKWITASTVFNYFYHHGDDIAVGRLLGTRQLGLYDMAYRISLIPLNDIAEVVSKVTFPVYVQISHDTKRLQIAFIKTILGVLAITLPIGMVLFLFPELIITVLLGEQWLPAADILRILAIFGVIRAVSSFSMSLFLSLGEQQIFTFITFVGLFVLGMIIIPLVSLWGIMGAAVAALIGTTATLPFIGYFIHKYLFVSTGQRSNKQ